jgi:hypothetical protein
MRPPGWAGDRGEAGCGEDVDEGDETGDVVGGGSVNVGLTLISVVGVSLGCTAITLTFRVAVGSTLPDPALLKDPWLLFKNRKTRTAVKPRARRAAAGSRPLPRDCVRPVTEGDVAVVAGGTGALAVGALPGQDTGAGR